MVENRFVVIIVEDQKSPDGQYIPCIVKEGEQGYYLTDWKWGKDIAEKLARDYNERLGLDKKEVMQLTLESMRESVQKHMRKNPRCKCGVVLQDDDISTVHQHLVKTHNMTIGEAVEQATEYIEFP